LRHDLARARLRFDDGGTVQHFAVRAGPVGQGQLVRAFLDEALQDGALGVMFERRVYGPEARHVAQGAGRVIDHGARAVRQVDHRVVVALLPGAAVVVRAVAVSTCAARAWLK
jgi:hypothetical protein